MCVKDNNKLNFLEYGNYIRRSINILPYLHPLRINGVIPVIMLKRCGIVWVRKISSCLNFRWKNLTGRNTSLIITREYVCSYSRKM